MPSVCSALTPNPCVTRKGLKFAIPKSLGSPKGREDTPAAPSSAGVEPAKGRAPAASAGEVPLPKELNLL